MYAENVDKLSISLPIFFINFINNYIATHNSKTPSHVIQEALQLLRDRELGSINCDADKEHNGELERAYRDAVQEFDTAWEITAKDGLYDETW